MSLLRIAIAALALAAVSPAAAQTRQDPQARTAAGAALEIEENAVVVDGRAPGKAPESVEVGGGVAVVQTSPA